MQDYWVWDGSIIRDDDGRWQMFASRWPKSVPMHPGWLFYSEIVRASADSAVGPYTFEEVVLPPRDRFYFDGRMTHNPSIRKVGDTYLLFYLGVSYWPDIEEELKPEDLNRADLFSRQVWMGKRIGLATAPSLHGPWTRRDQPILLPRQGKWDCGITTNPSPVIMPDGSIYMAYKSSHIKQGTKLQPFNVGIARADNWQSSFERSTDCPALRLPEGAYVEDPFLWYRDGLFHLIVKDINGEIAGEHGCGIYAWSEDAVNWQLGDPSRTWDRRIAWDDGSTERIGNVERPQLVFDENGKVTHLIVAIARSEGHLQGVSDSWVAVVPLAASK